MSDNIPDYTKELKDYANKLWEEPTIHDPGEVINKLLTMIGRLPEAASHHLSPVADAVEFAEFIVSHFDCEDFAHKPKWSGIMSGITKDDWTTEDLYKLFLSTRSDH